MLKTRLPRVLVIIAGLLLLTLFFAPLWRITLLAPQYPNGVHMHIYINKIGGAEPGTLQNVNILNHYIGMKPIEPDSIPELKFLPYVVIGLFVLALLTAWADNKKIYLSWVIFFGLCLAAGLYDFYLWEYDYGHNLDPTAAIKIPGQGYQPPLIGSKQILNFKAISTPMLGAYLMFAGMALTLFAFVRAKKE